MRKTPRTKKNQFDCGGGVKHGQSPAPGGVTRAKSSLRGDDWSGSSTLSWGSGRPGLGGQFSSVLLVNTGCVTLYR